MVVSNNCWHYSKHNVTKSFVLIISLLNIIELNKFSLFVSADLQSYYNKFSNLFLYYFYNSINSLSLFIKAAIFAKLNPVYISIGSL